MATKFFVVIHLTSIQLNCLSTDHVVVDEDFLGSGLHLVVIDVADDDGERRCSRNGRIAGILDDDRHMELLLLFAVERTQR